MTIEVTIRFENPREDMPSALAALRHDIKGQLVGGFYFQTEMSPAEVLELLEDEGLSICRFESIEFKPC